MSPQQAQDHSHYERYIRLGWERYTGWPSTSFKWQQCRCSGFWWMSKLGRLQPAQPVGWVHTGQPRMITWQSNATMSRTQWMSVANQMVVMMAKLTGMTTNGSQCQTMTWHSSGRIRLTTGRLGTMTKVISTNMGSRSTMTWCNNGPPEVHMMVVRTGTIGTIAITKLTSGMSMTKAPRSIHRRTSEHYLAYQLQEQMKIVMMIGGIGPKMAWNSRHLVPPRRHMIKKLKAQTAKAYHGNDKTCSRTNVYSSMHSTDKVSQSKFTDGSARKGGVQDQMYMDAWMINNIYSYIYINVYIYIYTSDRCK